jgi:hypothetical protein
MVFHNNEGYISLTDMAHSQLEAVVILDCPSFVTRGCLFSVFDASSQIAIFKMAKSQKIIVKGTAITILKEEQYDFISLTDMLKAKDGDFFISDWLRNRNTVEFLGIWESVYNPDFNYGEFAIIKSQAGLNNYKISAKDWVEKTNAIGLKATAGRYGGTYAHKDIAFEFGMWINPKFQLLRVNN